MENMWPLAILLLKDSTVWHLNLWFVIRNLLLDAVHPAICSCDAFSSVEYLISRKSVVCGEYQRMMQFNDIYRVLWCARWNMHCRRYHWATISHFLSFLATKKHWQVIYTNVIGRQWHLVVVCSDAFGSQCYFIIFSTENLSCLCSSRQFVEACTNASIVNIALHNWLE